MAQKTELRLVGRTERSDANAGSNARAIAAELRNGYRFEDTSRSGVMGLFQLPTVAGDGSIDMRSYDDPDGRLRLADPVDPAAVIRVGDALFGSTVTDVCYLDRRPNHRRIAFSYELADGRYGMAVATRCA